MRYSLLLKISLIDGEFMREHEALNSRRSNINDQTSAPDIFSCFLLILRTHFETGLVVISYYGYELWSHKWQVVEPFLSENACFFFFKIKAKPGERMKQSTYLCVILHVGLFLH